MCQKGTPATRIKKHFTFQAIQIVSKNIMKFSERVALVGSISSGVLQNSKTRVKNYPAFATRFLTCV